MTESDSKKHRPHRTLEEVLGALKKSSLKLTGPRRAILEALVEKHGPFTAEEIHKNITRRVCDLATVYRSMSSLEEAGILRRCEFGDGTARYELAEAGAHHHHVVCKSCKQIEIVDDQELEEIDRFARKKGYSDVSHVLEFFGICPNCR
jgi:Fe2+ or Zn2+ uptake regulation protein